MATVSSAVTALEDLAQSRLTYWLGSCEKVSYSIYFLLLCVMISCILTLFNSLQSYFAHWLKLQLEVRVEMMVDFSVQTSLS